MQWERVLYGFGAEIENAGRLHSIYEFTLREVPGHLIRIRVVETPEGQYFALPDHAVARGEDSPRPAVATESAINPEKALQNAMRTLLSQVTPPFDQLRLVRLQHW